MERSDGISFDYRSEIWIALYHEQLSEDDKKNAGIIWRVPQRTILYHSKKKTRSSWFLTIRSMEYVWGSNGHRAPFLFGFQSKHRNGHGQQHKRWGICTAYTIWTRTLNVGISDKYTWTLSRIEYDHMVLYCLEQRKTEKLGIDWKNLASLSKWFSVTGQGNTDVPSSPTACSRSSRTTITVALGGTVYLCWYNSQTLKLSPWFTGYCTYNVAIFVILRMIFSFKDLPVR